MEIFFLIIKLILFIVRYIILTSCDLNFMLFVKNASKQCVSQCILSKGKREWTWFGRRIQEGSLKGN